MKKIQKLFFATLATLMLTLTFSNIAKVAAASPPITKLTLKKSFLEMDYRTTTTLKVKLYPKKASAKSVKWKSLNKAVATVNSKGKVTAVGPGCTIIIARAGNIVDFCQVQVTYDPDKDGVFVKKKVTYNAQLVDGNVEITGKNNNPFTISLSLNPSVMTITSIEKYGESFLLFVDNRRNLKLKPKQTFTLVIGDGDILAYDTMSITAKPFNYFEW